VSEEVLEKDHKANKMKHVSRLCTGKNRTKHSISLCPGPLLVTVSRLF